MELITKSSGQTQSLGQALAADIASGKLSNTIALTGELGSGKTTFVQGLAKGLGIGSRIISPTFIIVRKYPLKAKDKEVNFKSFYHVDLYRLEQDLDKEILNLGLPYLWSDPQNVMVIEWAEKIRDFVPSSATWIFFEALSENKRRIEIK
jgi:tRNA threonylcarbamoyladenosine biosynthesis protein TsaE